MGPNQANIRSLTPIWVGATSAVTMALPAGVGWLQLPEPGDRRVDRKPYTPLTTCKLQTAAYEWIHE